MKQIIMRLQIAFIVACAIFIGEECRASAIFKWSSTCVTDPGGFGAPDCSNIGLPDGGAVNATLVLDEGFLAPNVTIGKDAVESFFLDFGNIQLSGPPFSPPYFTFSATLNVTATELSVYSIFATLGLDDGTNVTYGDTVSLFSQSFDGNWRAGPRGKCFTAECTAGPGPGSRSFISVPWAAGPVSAWALEPDVPTIPAPAALPLLATALAGLGLLGWRHQKSA